MRRSSPDRRRRRRLRALLAAAAALPLASCVTRTLEEGGGFDLEGVPKRLPAQVSPEILAERSTRIDRSITLSPRGFLAADSATPPLISPDGRFVAVQSRPTPSWNDLLGWTSGVPMPPPAVAVAALPAEPIAELAATTLREPLLLGNAADARGFLVESPRGDGARWIGAVRWDGSGIEWIVADAGVNAMATRAADGAIAWCRSDAAGEPASLRLRERDGSLREWPPAPGSTWLAPRLSGDGRFLFAIKQGDGRAWLVAIDRAAPEGEAKAVELSLRTSAATSLAATFALGSGSTLEGEGSWLVLHPEDRALRRWHPGLDAFDRFPDGSFAWTTPIAGGRLLADRGGIWFVESSAEGDPDASLIVDGPWIPRVVGMDEPGASAAGRAILFTASGDGYELAELSIGPRAGTSSTPGAD